MDGDLDGPGPLLATLILVLLAVAFGAIDAGLGALGEVRLQAMAKGEGREARAAAGVLQRLTALRGRLLLGRAVALTSAALLTAQALGGTGELAVDAAIAIGLALGYATLSFAATTYAQRRAGGWVLVAVAVARPLELVLLPFAMPILWVSSLIAVRVQPEKRPDDDEVAQRGLEAMIEGGQQEGAIEPDHARLLRNVLEFKDTVAHEVMVPRTKMVAFDISTPLAEVLDAVVAKGHSRYPVYRDKVDQVVGLLYAKDLFAILQAKRSLDQFRLDNLIRQRVFFAAEGQLIGTLLREMQIRRVHLAIVVDEFGGTSGIVTLEDILEEIVGDIRDEYDRDQTQVLEVGMGTYLVDAGISVYDLEEQLGIRLRTEDDDGDYDSVGGMVVELSGHVPPIGVSLEIGDFTLTVRDSDARHVRRVELRRHGVLPAE